MLALVQCLLPAANRGVFKADGFGKGFVCYVIHVSPKRPAPSGEQGGLASGVKRLQNAPDSVPKLDKYVERHYNQPQNHITIGSPNIRGDVAVIGHFLLCRLGFLLVRLNKSGAALPGVARASIFFPALKC